VRRGQQAQAYLARLEVDVRVADGRVEGYGRRRERVRGRDEEGEVPEAGYEAVSVGGMEGWDGVEAEGGGHGQRRTFICASLRPLKHGLPLHELLVSYGREVQQCFVGGGGVVAQLVEETLCRCGGGGGGLGRGGRFGHPWCLVEVCSRGRGRTLE
jgi:hypothetical protein